MNDLDKLYNNLIEDGLIDPNKMKFDRFKGLFLENENYRSKVHTKLFDKKLYKNDFETFTNKYAQKKNQNPNDQNVSAGLGLQFSENTVSSALFDEGKSSEYRTYFPLGNALFGGVPKTEKDLDGQYLKGAFGDFINALPFGDFIDDQARAWSSGQEDADVVEAGATFFNNQWTESKNSVEDAERMLKELQETRNTAVSDEGKLFQKIYEEEGGDTYAALKAIAKSPGGAVETVTRSMSSMFNWESAKVGATAAVTSVVAGAATGPGIVAGAALALPAAMVTAGANTDMMISFANYFEEELGENYTREDIKALLEDSEKMSALRNKAFARGLSIAAVGALTARLGMSVAANTFKGGRRGLKPTLEAAGKVSLIDMIGGSTGEFTAQVASGEEIKSGEIVLEGLLDPVGSSVTTLGGFVKAASAPPSYTINKGRTTKADFLNTIKSMTDEQLKATAFEVNNDEQVFDVLDERMQAIKISDEITEAYGVDIDNEQKRRLAGLEVEKRKLKNKTSEAAKDRLSEIDTEIKEVLDIYKTKRDAIGILSAPYYDRQISSVEDAQQKRKSREYKQYKNKAKRLAETMGLNVTDMHDAIGGFTHPDGNYVQELSSEVVLEGATYEQAIEYASLLGAITPETQESTIAGMVVGEGEGNASQVRISIQDSNALEGARSVLDALQIDYSLNTDTGEVVIIDLDEYPDADYKKKVATFVNTLTDNNINYEEKSERIRSKYISADDRRASLQQTKQNSDKYGKNGESIRYITEQAEKRNEEYITKRDAAKAKKPDNIEGTVNTVGDNVKNKFSIPIKIAQTKKWFRRQFLNTFYSGAGSDKKTEEIIRGFGRQKTAIQFELGNDVAIFNNQFISEIKKMSSKDAYAYQDAINDYLSGRDAVVSEEMKPILDEMRTKIDGASQKLIDRLKKIGGNKESTQDLIKTLEENKGQYLHRAYAAFKDVSYMKELLSDPSMARTSINDSYDRLVFETAQAEGISIEDAKSQVDQYLIDTFSTPDRGTLMGSLAEGKTSSPFLKKKNPKLTAAFRALMGEINDPLYNYVNTMEKISSYIAAAEYQDKLSSHLLATGLASTKPTARSNKKLELSKGAFGPLTDLYVDEEVFDAYRGMQKLDPVTSFKTLIAIQSAVKVGKTIYSPTTTARNYLSGTFIAALNGTNIINPSNWSSAKKAFSVGWTNAKTKKEVLAEAKSLIELGVLQDGGQSQELVGIINDIFATEQMISKSGESASNTKKFGDSFVKLYSFGDDFFKALSFYSTTKKFVDSGMDIETAKIRAAERVRKGQPTYSELPKNIRGLRRNVLVSTFVSFPYLIVKAHKENLKFIAEDFREGRNKMAIQHSINMLGVQAATYGLAEASKALWGITDEEDKALRDMGSDYYRDTKFVYTGKDSETNELRYFDVNSIAPSAQIQKPLQILLEDRQGRDFPDKMLRAGGEFLSPFLGADLTTNVLTGVLTGYEIPRTLDQKSKKVPGETITERVPWGLSQLAPGAFGNIQRFARATGTFGQEQINPITGRKYTVKDEFLALGGLRSQTVKWDDLLTSYSRRELRMAHDYFDNAVDVADSQSLLSNEKIGTAVSDYEQDLIKHSDNLIHQVEVARKSGIDEVRIVKTLELANIGKTDIDNIMSGQRMEMKSIGAKRYTQTVSTYRDNPEIADAIGKNLDRFNFFINEKNVDGRVKNKLYEFASTNPTEDEVVDFIWKSSESIYDRYATKFSGEAKLTEYERSDNVKKQYERYKQIYLNYQSVINENAFAQYKFPAKALVDMVYEPDAEVKSLLLFKFLEGDHSDENLNALNITYKRLSGREMTDTVKDLIKLRIEAYK